MRQGLVQAKILKGVRGPRGGYELARDRRRITIGEIVRTAMSLSTADPEDLGANSVLIERVIDPAVRRAGETFLANLDAITVKKMCEAAEKAHVLDDERQADAATHHHQMLIRALIDYEPRSVNAQAVRLVD